MKRTPRLIKKSSKGSTFPRNKPVAGILSPEQELTVSLDPHIDSTKSVPLIVTGDPTYIRILTFDDVSVTIKNVTKRRIPYVMIITPALVQKAISLPWGQVVNQIANTNVKSFLSELTATFFRGDEPR